MHNFVKTLFSVLLLLFCSVLTAQNRMNDARDPNRIWLDSEVTHHGDYQWKMMKAGDITDPGEKISLSDYPTGTMVASHCSRYSLKFFSV